MDINDVEIVTPTHKNTPLIERFSVKEGSLIVLKCKPGIYLRVFINVDYFDFDQPNFKNVDTDNFLTDYYVCHPEDLHIYGGYSAFSNLMPKNTFIGIESYNRMARNLMADLPMQLDFKEEDLPSYEEYKELCQHAFVINLLVE